MKSQKILWINPSFLDYRLPLYAELDKLCNNSFYILYSKERVPKRCHSKIQEILGKRASSLQLFSVYTMGYMVFLDTPHSFDSSI